MYRFLAAVAAIAVASHIVGTANADNGRLMACMQEARKQNIAQAEAGAFVRDCMIGAHGSSFGAPKDSAASVPAPSGCADKNVLNKVRSQYLAVEAKTGQKVLEISDIREALLGPPPRSANQYATATTFIAISRYCEGNVKFDSGQSERVYWRIDTVKDGADSHTRVDHCSEPHDVFQNGCAHVIAGKEN